MLPNYMFLSKCQDSMEVLASQTTQIMRDEIGLGRPVASGRIQMNNPVGEETDRGMYGKECRPEGVVFTSYYHGGGGRVGTQEKLRGATSAQGNRTVGKL
jgi:hypothetical protein